MDISSQNGREDSQSGATPAPAADNSATSSWTQLGGDETKCCLGFFECESLLFPFDLSGHCECLLITTTMSLVGMGRR